MNNDGYNRRKTDNNINMNYNNNDDNYEMENVEELSSHNYNKRHSDNNMINSNTLINLDPSKPIGIDMNKFMNNIHPDETVHHISQSNDLPLIAEVNNKILISDR
jgi:hypothetical protein